jgi:predicted nucleotidyltransferase
MLIARCVCGVRDIEQRYNVRVLYACESGSRGWGFASPDSDYDVRFLYVHRPEWYLRVEAQRDVIELPIDDELDVCGWEWRKALGLLKGANPTLIEWLDSPVVYQEDETVVAELRALIPAWFSPLRARWHYYSMARKTSVDIYRGNGSAEKVLLCSAPFAGGAVGRSGKRRSTDAFCRTACRERTVRRYVRKSMHCWK